jgi:surfeit locus 1 family protein
MITALALLAVGITNSLGVWQLSRAAQKEALQASVRSQTQLPELDGATLLGKLDSRSLINRRITLTGQWQEDKTVFLDNRQMNAKVGFHVVTPLQLQGSSLSVLVQRGWVARNFEDRLRVPLIDTPTGQVQVSGLIAPPPAKLYELGAAQPGPIRQNLDVAAYSAETGLTLAPVSVQQLGSPSERLLRDWPAQGLGIDKHYGYAFQWFGLSALLATLYVWFQIVRRFILRPQA